MTATTAGDLMIPLERYPHIPYWFTIKQAIVEIEHGGSKAAPGAPAPDVVLIFNESYQLLGMVRRRDLLRGLEPAEAVNRLVSRSRLIRFMRGKSAEPVEQAVAALAARAERPVSDVMRPIRDSLDSGEPVLAVATRMVDNDLSLLPVSRDGNIVGIVRSEEVLRAVARLLGQG